MSSKTHPKLTLTEDEMVERIRQAQQEDRDGSLIHIKDEEELRAFLVDIRSSNR